MKKLSKNPLSLISAFLAVTVLSVSVMPFLAACDKQQSVDTGKAVYITDFSFNENGSLSAEISDEGIVIRSNSAVTEGGEYVCGKVPELNSGYLYLNVTYCARNFAEFDLLLIYKGESVSYRSAFSANATATGSTVLINYGKTLTEIRLRPVSLQSSDAIIVKEIFVTDDYKGTPIIKNEPEGDYSQGGDGGNSSQGGGQSGNSSQGGGSSQGGQGGENDSSLSGGYIDYSDPQDPRIVDGFDDEGFFNGGNNGEASQSGTVNDKGTDDNGDDSGEKVVPIEYEVIDDSPISVEARLCNKYTDYFSVGMTAGYSRYDAYKDLEGHFNSFTCENEMKMYTIASDDNENFDYKDISTYDFSQADEMLVYMRSKGKKIRGHALIWYQEAPKWFANCKDKDKLLDMVDVYCYNVVKHFSEKFGDVIYAWDVVNEAVSDNYGGDALTDETREIFGFNKYENGCNSMRSNFYSVAGIDYIVHAFKAARKADKNVKLFYNDYNLAAEHQKLRGVINLITKLIKAGAPIDGVGIQGHSHSLDASFAAKEETVIKTLIKTADVTGHPLDIQVTELDVENYGNNDAGLKTFYGSLFKVFRDYSEYISNVTFWGVADDYSWLDHGQYRMAKPFLFDANQQAKPAFDAVYNFC